jgi:uncharacterized membrane protein
LANPKDDSEGLPTEILNGGDHYRKIVKDTTPIRVSPSVVLLPSKLGWDFSGNNPAIAVISFIVTYVNLQQWFSRSDDVVLCF